MPRRSSDPSRAERRLAAMLASPDGAHQPRPRSDGHHVRTSSSNPGAWVPTVPGAEVTASALPEPAPDLPTDLAPEPATTVALRQVRDDYAAQHGHPLERVPPVRRRLRWAVTWRAAAAAAVALAIIGGAVAIRAASVAAGPAVVLPVPSPEGSAACVTGCAPAAAPGQAPSVASSPPPAATVVVHVVGAVRHHGVVHLPVGARVGDAVDAAGGATTKADLDELNLARVLVDGEQIVVPRVGERSATPPSEGTAEPAPGPTGASAPLDVNTADVAALDALPGIGPVLAQRVVDFRAEHPFTSVDQLEDVPGIGPALMERLRALVRV